MSWAATVDFGEDSSSQKDVSLLVAPDVAQQMSAAADGCSADEMASGEDEDDVFVVAADGRDEARSLVERLTDRLA